MNYANHPLPVYRVLDVSGFYAGDHLYELDSEIEFDGEPNEELEPLNELARTRLNTYLDKLDEEAKKAAEKAGKQFVGRPRNLEGGLELASAVQRAQTAVMGHLVQKESSVTVNKLNSEGIVPETGSITPKRGRGRPPGTVKTKGNLALG